MRVKLVLMWLLLALTAQAVTPELGKDRLRRLVRLPTVAFEAEWRFDPELGFLLGTGEQDARAKIAELRKDLTGKISDAEAYASLGGLYATFNDRPNSQLAWATAAEFYRKRVEQQPENGLLLAGLGRALEETHSASEAESVLRHAVHVAPKEWKCQVALAHFLDTQARREIEGAAADAGTADGQPGRLRPAQVALAQKHLAEAGEGYDRAATIASEEAEVYFRRGMHRCLRSFLLNQVQLASGGQSDGMDVFADCFSRESLADLQRASRLDGRNYRRMAGTAVFEIYSACAKKGSVDWDQFTWNSLPDGAQRSLHESVTRLENLGQDPDPRFAAGALEALGILQGPILHEPQRCIASLRRALALDPARVQAWETLAGTLAQAHAYAELLELCDDQAKRDDAPRNHLLLAKAYEKLRQWDNCEDQVRLAMREDDANFTASLALASLLLRRSDGDAAALADANNWLARSEYLLAKIPKDRRSQQQLIELTLSRSIYFALSDDVATAREWASAVMQVDKENKVAREILAATNY
jgi:tetratricopeptide (TPR) repeat protein